MQKVKVTPPVTKKKKKAAKVACTVNASLPLQSKDRHKNTPHNTWIILSQVNPYKE